MKDPLLRFKTLDDLFVGIFDKHACIIRHFGCVIFPLLSTGQTSSIPSRLQAKKSTSPKAGAQWTIPVPSSLVTASSMITRNAFSWARSAKYGKSGSISLALQDGPVKRPNTSYSSAFLKYLVKDVLARMY